MTSEPQHQHTRSFLSHRVQLGSSQGKNNRSGIRQQYRFNCCFVILTNLVSRMPASVVVAIILIQVSIFGYGSQKIQSGAADSKSAAESVDETAETSEDHNSLSIQQLSKHLQADLRKSPKRQVAPDSVLELLRPRLLQTNTAKQLGMKKNPRLLSSMLKYGDDPQIQLLAYYLIVERLPKEKKLAAMLAISELKIGYNGVSSAFIEVLSAPWEREEIELVTATLNAGMSPPRSLVNAGLLAGSIPTSVQISLLTSDDGGIARSADWDAVFLASMNMAIAEERLETLFPERSKCEIVARDLMRVSGRAQYEAMWFLSNEVSVNFCVDYLIKNSASLSEIQLRGFIDRFSLQLQASQKSGKQLPPDVERRLSDKALDRVKKESK